MRIENKLEMCRMVKMRKNRLMKRKEIQKKVEEYQNRTFKADNEKYNLEPEAEEDEEMIDRLSEKNYSEKYDTDEETNSESENNDNEDVIKVDDDISEISDNSITETTCILFKGNWKECQNTFETKGGFSCHHMTMHRKKYSQTRKIDYEERNKENSDSEDESKKAKTDKDGTLSESIFEEWDDDRVSTSTQNDHELSKIFVNVRNTSIS